MKKLMFAVAAIAAGAAMAVESQVVGYQNVKVNSNAEGGFTWPVMTLPKVGADHDEVTLGSFKAVADEAFWSAGTCQIMLLNAAGQCEGNYVYLDYDLADAEGVAEGWYDYDEYNRSYEWVSAASVKVPYGYAFMVMSDMGCNLQFAGQVEGDKTVTVNSNSEGGFTWTGNCTAKNRTLADMTAWADEAFWSAGTCQLMLLNAAGQCEGNYVYLDYDLADAEGVAEGWYDYDEYNRSYEWVSAGSVAVGSGAGVMIMSDMGCKLTVLSALK